MIIERDGKWFVVSEAGDKDLGGPYDSKAEAEIEGMERAQQVFRAEVPCRVLQAADIEGKSWDIEITRTGPANGTPAVDWPLEVVERDLQVFDGMASYEGHTSADVLRQGLGKPLEKLLGHIGNPRMEGGSAVGTLNLLEPAKWGPKFRTFQSLPDGIVGMSLDIRYVPDKRRGEGGRMRVAQIIRHPLNSLDLVSPPGGGGRILRAVASAAGEQWEEVSPNAEPDPTAGTKQGGGGDTAATGRTKMKELIERILQAIKRFDPARAGAVEAEVAAIEKEEDKLNRVTQVLVEIEAPKAAEPAKPAPALSAEDKQALADAKATVAAARVMQCQAVLRTALSDSKLPVPLQAEIERRFTGREFKAEDLAEDIKQVRQAYASLVPAGRITHPTVRITMQDTDKLQIALDKVCGLTHEVKIEEDARGLQRITQGAALASEIPAFRGLREAYVAYTGDVDIRGETNVERILQVFNTAGFPYALAATLNRLLLKDYAAVNYRERELITSITSPSDFKTQERIRVGYFGDLDTVGEDGTYDEIAAYTDEKISYSVITKGNTWTLTRRAIINDDIGAVKASVGRAGRSAARTFAQYVWNFFINIPTYDPTGLAWAHGTHGNLGSTGLNATMATNVATMNAMRLALFNMTEKDSGKKLGLNGPYLMVVPIEVEYLAKAFNQAQYTDASFTPNPYYHAFGVNDERIVTLALTTDADDWGIFDISGNVDILEIGFLQGRQNPEIFLADNPVAGQMFTQDRIQYKIRHEYAGDILDYRGFYKQVV